MRNLLFILLTLGAFLASPLCRGASAPPPNILFIIADDLGYADVGFNGAKDIKTPNIDKLRAAGAKLENYYVQPLCSPTRASLLTGRYPMRYGLQVGVLRPWEQRGVPLTERLLPQALKEVGYSTAIVGKWHLGHHQRAYLPTNRGFDVQYGQYSGQIDYFTHIRDDAFDWHRNDKACHDEGYSTHLIAKEAVRLLGTYSANKPFFLYVPFNAVHSPHEVPDSYKKPYQDLPEPRRTYAGMLAAMDEAIGQICAALEQRGLRRNTLILFSSDNGGPAPGRVTDNTPLRGGKGSVYEGGTHVCACVAWDEHIKPGSTISTPLHAVDWFPTLTKLAGVTSKPPHPLDGIDVSQILTGGNKLAEREILINTSPNAGAIRVGNWKLIVKGMAGADAALAKGEASAADEETATAKKKARKKRADGDATSEAELFNLAEDIGEQKNLATENPEKLKELRARYDTYAKAAVAPSNQLKPADFKPPKVWGEAD